MLIIFLLHFFLMLCCISLCNPVLYNENKAEPWGLRCIKYKQCRGPTFSYILPLKRIKACSSIQVSREDMSECLIYRYSMCFRFFFFLCSSWIPLWPRACLLKRIVFREILWDMEINLAWQDENFLDKLPLPWRLSTKVYVTVMNLQKLMATVKCLPFSCLQIQQSP